jgi:hypothetical protein
MADDNRFFRWLWRINGLLFFLMIFGAILLWSYSLLTSGPLSREETVPAQTKSGGETYAFGVSSVGGPAASSGAPQITHLDGTDEGVMVLQRGGPREYGLDRGGARFDANDVNYLLIDLQTMKTRWLFHGVKRDIGDTFLVRRNVYRAGPPGEAELPNPFTALLMPVAEADTNGDGKINAADRHALYAYRIGAENSVKLFDAQSISGMEQLDADRVEVTYFDGKSIRAALLSMKDFHAIADTALPTMPN